MRIAIIAPIAWRTPPRKYGPWEQVVSNLTEGLVQKGIDVTLFATGDSITCAKLQAVCPGGYAENSELDAKVEECLHISQVMERANEFDLIHNHFDFLPLTYSRLINTPMVTTIHGFSSPKILPVYQKYNATNVYVSISHSDRHSTLDYSATVYNGIKTQDFTFREKSKGDLLFFGRIHPEKGTLEAIKIAKKSGRRLLISGLIQDQVYFDDHIKPLLNNTDIVYVGNSGPQDRDRLLGQADALLHPILFNEPFGLSVAEAMMCGTPVIAFHRGSMSELIVEGKTGFLVKDVDGAVDALVKLPNLNRQACHDWALSHFSREKMVEGYLSVYRLLIGGSLF